MNARNDYKQYRGGATHVTGDLILGMGGEEKDREINMDELN